jgi:hypothetical protein
MATRIVHDQVSRSCIYCPGGVTIDQKTWVRHLRRVHRLQPQEIRLRRLLSIIYRPFHEERD